MARDRTKSPSEPNGKEYKHEESEGVEEKRHGEDEEPHSKKKDRRKKSKRKYESSTDDGDDSSEDEGDKKQGKGKKKKDKRKRSSKRSSRKRYSDEDSSSSEPYSSDSEESESESGSESSGHESESEEERRRRKSKERKRRRKEREYEKEKRRKRKEKERKRKRKEKEERKKKKEGKKGAVTNSWGKYGIIRETDMWNKRPEFTAWLAEVKKVNLESLPNWEEKQMFKEFMEDHNTATFSSKKYYDLEAYHRHKLENEMKKGLKNLGKAERTIFDDEAQRRKELLIAREKQKEEEVETLKRSMQGGMAQAMKEQAQLREEMAYQYKLGNFEAAAAIQRRLDPDVAM